MAYGVKAFLRGVCGGGGIIGFGIIGVVIDCVNSGVTHTGLTLRYSGCSYRVQYVYQMQLSQGTKGFDIHVCCFN